VLSSQNARIRQLEVANYGDIEEENLGRALQGLDDDDNETDVNATTIAENDIGRMVVELATAMDHMWLLICGSLVMFMQAGFAMVEAGCCRAKNVQNILMKNLSDVCIGTLGWWALGWAMAYGHDRNKGFIPGGESGFFGMGFNRDEGSGRITPNDGNLALNWFFQWAFCSAAATIVSGGVAERVRFGGYAFYSLTMTGFIYPVVVSWTWGFGWLSSEVNDVNFVDFAGAGIVHLTGGTGALVGAVIAGSRNGRWEYPEEFVPHSLPLVVLGTFILWFGWYGFNCGSTLSMHDAKTGMLAAQVAMNTTISAATGGISVFAIRLIILRKYDVGGLCNGVLAGLVSITAGCSNVESGSAFCIGLIGGCIYHAASTLIRFAKIDDPIDAFPVHGACGAWGLMAAALFDWGRGFDHVHGFSGWDCMREAKDDGTVGCMTGKGGQLVAANAVMLVTIVAWSGTISAIIFTVLRVFGYLRATNDNQDEGMDASCAVKSAYTLEDAHGIVADGHKKKSQASDLISLPMV
jgi:Amt family ammonium transporter